MRADLTHKLRVLIDREERRQSYLQAAYSFVLQHHNPESWQRGRM